MKQLLILLFLGALVGCGTAPSPMVGGKPVKHWIVALQDPDVRVRKTAVAKLGNSADEGCLPALIGALKDEDAAVRSEAILALLKCGLSARKAAAALTLLEQHDESEQVRTYATKALARLKELK